MSSQSRLSAALRAGAYDSALTELNGSWMTGDALAGLRARAERVTGEFCDRFSRQDSGMALFSAPGRTELGGNHTDHQHGHVLCASVDMDMLACAAPNSASEIRVISEGYPAVTVKLDSLEPVDGEKGTTCALVRGVAAGIRARGYRISGFDAFVSSEVLSGSGLSSSAAFEILIGNILNRFFCRGELDSVELAKLGQQAENVYFGKPCGLMDQLGASVGGAIAVDFAVPDAPAVEQIHFDFAASGHVLCIVDTASDHADLTEDYAQIPREMSAVAAYFGKTVLREVDESLFRGEIPALRRSCGDRAVLRALHYYHDDHAARAEAEALAQGDFEGFLKLVNASGLSSELCLQNAWSPANPRQQSVPMALAFGRELLEGSGAIRVHGGGFAGTIQAFVPQERLEIFRTGMEQLLGAGRCHVLHIRPRGGCMLGI